MQLLCRFDTPDYDEWKKTFDADAEDRMNAGLTLLQLWRDADTPSAALALFEVNDRKRAQAWIEKETGFGHALTADFLKPAL
ncbi:hypothetical protein [Tranquillimonas alkanivorans]|uniref:Uncharacterized protein n=1 Tax=Tranquillimonas alkanivorans TaxID=441119 RepID=A0A1I5PG14_9RHOB|nr:hypothetical protein [Tranquillimonas alkanivorans]SFP32426.1 hypothetical protein SAMN04488047_10566 [Tranquillimonas alkanivorans]